MSVVDDLRFAIRILRRRPTACFVPAHRATRIDPIRVLREE